MRCAPRAMPSSIYSAVHLTLMLSVLLLALGSFYANAMSYASSNNQINVTNEFTHQPAGLHTRQYLDHDHSTELYNAMALADDQWLIPNTETTSFGFRTDRLWLKLPISNSSDQTRRLGLEIAYPVLDKVTAYVTQDGFVQAQYTMGDSVNFNQRPVEFRNFIVPLQLPAGESATLYLSVESEGTLQAPVTLWDMDHFFEKQQPALVAHGLYFGIMLVMILYNLFIYFSIRHITYLYYTIAALSCAGINASLQGLGFQFIWPSMPELNAISVPVTVAIFGISSKLFAIHLLNLQTTAPNLYRLKLGIVTAYSLILIAQLFLPYHHIIRMILVVGVCSILLGTYTGLYLFIKGYRIARFYLLAWSCLFGALFLTALSKGGFIPSNHFIEHSLQYGSALEVILLSFAMADRISQERKAKREAQQLATDSDKRANEEARRYLELKYQTELDELKSRQAIVQAQAESKAKSEFLATMSHEIRTPMNGVLGMADLLQETELDSRQRHYLKVITSSGKALLNIINDILDYSKIAAGKMQIEQIDFDLKQLIEECALVFSLMAESKRIELVSSIAEGTPYLIKADPSRLRQIIINLLGNAFKFTHSGQIRLQVTQLEPGQGAEDLTLKFEVRDTGVGIERHKLAMLFTAFSQADSHIAREYGGTGLGLSISKRLAELMGGQIGAESQLGEGSNFWFTIKCCRADAEFCGRQSSTMVASDDLLRLDEENSPLHGKSILVAEDNSVNQMVISGMLHKLGLKCEMAENGEQALILFTQHPNRFDLVFMDCEMPVMDGYSTCRKMRDHEQANKLPPTPIIALSAHALQEHQLRAREAGMDDHLAKPIDLLMLKEKLIEFLLVDERNKQFPPRSNHGV